MNRSHRINALVTSAALLAATLLPGAVAHADGLWIDAAEFPDWNIVGAPIPRAPQADQNSAACDTSPALRNVESQQDAQLVQAGWHLFGGVESGWGVTIIKGAAGFDGMCRPMAFNQFVFADGLYAGRISPDVMDSREDGSGWVSDLETRDALIATYNRYTNLDPLCCPSSTSSVPFYIDRTRASMPVLRRLR
jgi:hypothetical protein